MVSKEFSLSDQIWFSEISGDYNPIHVNPIYARKSLFGEVIVHGIHLVIFSLNELYNYIKKDIFIERLSSTFLKPLKLGQQVKLEFENISDTNIKIKLIVDALTVTVIDVTFSESIESKKWQLNENQATLVPPFQFEAFEGNRSIALGIYKEGIDEKYSNLPHILTSNQLLNLLALTCIVGMKSPGLNSIFSSFILNFKDNADTSELNYNIKSYKENYSRLVLALESGTVSGSLVAFTRPTSKEGLTTETALSLASKYSFGSQRALVIGGSRGLGSITTKLLWAGGAEVLFTYHKGQDEAQKIVDEIGDGKVNTFKLDVTAEFDIETIEIIKKFSPTHIYYYVTPFIFSTNKGVFNFDFYVNFSNYYLKGFYQLVQLCNDGNLTHIFYPSSIAIDDLVDNMIEYSCAKVAGELLCDFIGKMNPDLHIYTPRLPRLDTDQTLSLLRIDGVDTNTKILDSILELANL